ncbi:hypothetical protein LINGRAPRIM_LOCUS3275 [Linum grandiflorum]
MVWW